MIHVAKICQSLRAQNQIIRFYQTHFRSLHAKRGRFTYVNSGRGCMHYMKIIFEDVDCNQQTICSDSSCIVRLPLHATNVKLTFHVTYGGEVMQANRKAPNQPWTTPPSIETISIQNAGEIDAVFELSGAGFLSYLSKAWNYGKRSNSIIRQWEWCGSQADRDRLHARAKYCWIRHVTHQTDNSSWKQTRANANLIRKLHQNLRNDLMSKNSVVVDRVSKITELIFSNSDDSYDTHKNYLLKQTKLTCNQLNSLFDKATPLPLTFGAIFRLEGMLVDVSDIYFQAWKIVAHESHINYREPTLEDATLAQLYNAKHAIEHVLFWTNNSREIKRVEEKFNQVLDELFHCIMENFGPTNIHATSFFVVMEGASQYLESLCAAKIPCAIISRCNPSHLDFLLRATRLSKYFPNAHRVSSADKYYAAGHETLAAALRIERRTECCAIHDSTPSSISAAHEIDAKSIALAGSYPERELAEADVVAEYWGSLDVDAIGDLFEKGGGVDGETTQKYEAGDSRAVFGLIV